MKSFTRSAVTCFILFSSFTIRNHNTVKEYFTIPGPVIFNNIKFQLSWSAHPSATYYKQEYLPAGEAADTYGRMMMIEAVTGDVLTADVVKAKIAEMEQRKKTDPLANYQVIRNAATGEYILDFIMSEAAGTKTTVAEWNVYRYMLLPGGKKGLVLLAFSKRGYGDGVTPFLSSVKTQREKRHQRYCRISNAACTHKK